MHTEINCKLKVNYTVFFTWQPVNCTIPWRNISNQPPNSNYQIVYLFKSYRWFAWTAKYFQSCLTSIIKYFGNLDPELFHLKVFCQGSKCSPLLINLATNCALSLSLSSFSNSMSNNAFAF